MSESAAPHRPLIKPQRWLALMLLWPLSGLYAAEAPPPSQRQMQLLSSNCVQCHARPGIGAPLMGNPADWKERQAQGEEILLKHVVEGIGGMPPLGYCSACDEADFRVLIRLIVPTAQVQP